MTAETLVAALRAKGVELQAHGDRLRFRPGEAVTREEREALRQHKAEVLALLADPAPEVARRVEAFRDQLERWTHARRTGVPILHLPGVDSHLGQCISCGDPLPPDRTYRCAPCVAAVEAVLGLPPPLAE